MKIRMPESFAPLFERARYKAYYDGGDPQDLAARRPDGRLFDKNRALEQVAKLHGFDRPEPAPGDDCLTIEFVKAKPRDEDPDA